MIGETIGQYRILGQLGSGGMGVVYQAHDNQEGRTVALKFLPQHLVHDTQARRRFMAEARAASALKHPNVCTVHHIQDHDNRSFIAMEYVEGLTLKQRIQQSQISIEEALDVLYQAVQGLQAAHACGITHRDIKPANLMVNTNGKVKLMDFGVAKVHDSTEITTTGSMLGTAAYMSPEQTRGEAVDHRSDLWSMGVVFYEMLTGERPFQGDYVPSIIYAILHTEPPLPEDLPRPVQHILSRLLSKDPDKRYPHTNALLADLAPLRDVASYADYRVEEPEKDYLSEDALLLRYLEVKAEIKQLEEELKSLQPRVLDTLWDASENKRFLLGHELAVGSRKTYEYSEEVQELQGAVRALKKQEEKNGIATLARHTSYVIVRQMKR